jgi:hypothetical protein
MIWHIAIAALATWLSLAVIVHVALFIVGLASDTENLLYCVLLKIGHYLIAPVLVPTLYIWCQYRHWRRLFRLARIIDRQLAHSLDMRVLPRDEQRQFIERMHSNEDMDQVIADAMTRIREAQEVAE